MTRDVIIRLSLSEEEAERFEGKTAMVLPLSDAELVRLRGCINTVDDYLKFNLKCLRTLRQIAEDTPSSLEQIANTLDRMLEPAANAAQLHDTAREWLGAAYFIGPSKPERLQ